MVKRCTRISLSSCVNGSIKTKSMHYHQPTNHHHPLMAQDYWQCHGTLNWQFHWMTVSIKFISKPVNFLKLRLLRPRMYEKMRFQLFVACKRMAIERNVYFRATDHYTQFTRIVFSMTLVPDVHLFRTPKNN